MCFNVSGESWINSTKLTEENVKALFLKKSAEFIFYHLSDAKQSIQCRRPQYSSATRKQIGSYPVI